MTHELDLSDGDALDAQWPCKFTHHPKCYQRTGVPDDLPAGLCDCKVLRMLPATPGAGEVCPAIHSTNPCTTCEMPTDDLIEQIAQELERKARVARVSKAAVPDDFERADVTRGNFDQQAWAFDQAARVVREFR